MTEFDTTDFVTSHNKQPRRVDLEPKETMMDRTGETTPQTLRQVNAALRRAGHAERLFRGEGYYYFAEGEAHTWTQSGVYVYRVRELTIEAWLRTRDSLAADRNG